MTEDQHDHPGHGDATLDVIALTEASLNDDDDAYEALIGGMLGSENLSHVLGTFAGFLGEVLTTHHGREGALKVLSHQRGHALGSHECGHDAAVEPSEPPTMEEAAEHIAFEVSDISEAIRKLGGELNDNMEGLGAALLENGTELTRLTSAVERLGDILDKRLA
jgi:hypothetical protein